MSFFKRILNQYSVKKRRKSKHFIRIMDDSGQEIRIDRDTWCNEILPRNLKQNWQNPDALYSLIVSAVQDNILEEVLPAVRHLQTIDTDPERAAIIHAILALKLKKTAESKAILTRFIKQHGKTAAALTNLAKVYAEEKKDTQARKLLWEAITLNPNLDNAVQWWCALEDKDNGPAAMRRELKRIMKLPNSWRARLILAAHHLKRQRITEALSLYKEALQMAPGQKDVLLHISAELGKAGHHQTALSLIGPVYDPATHGPYPGINLLQLCLQLNNPDEGRRILRLLQSEKAAELTAPLQFFKKEFNYTT